MRGFSMRATSLQTSFSCSELPSIPTVNLHAVCPHRGLSLGCRRLEHNTAAKRKGACKSGFQVRSCVVAAPERHHTLYRSELGYRTDFTEQYSLLEVIGKGSFGTVWLAASRQEPSHQVAVKIIAKSRGDRSHAESLECIRREVALWGCLSGDSRYVAQLLGLYEDADNVYLVQQLCQGGDLAEALKDGPLPEACCAAVMWCVLSAIRDCHDHHLALIDVKPQNFLLTGCGPDGGGGGDGAAVRQLRLEDQIRPGPGGPCVVACDFGCSLSYTELMRGAKRAGSPVFFAPEQFTSKYGLVVDEWASGVMLYLLLTGRYPFWDCKREEMDKSLPAYQVMLAVCSAPIAFSGPEWRGISRDARDLVNQLLDRNPGTRLTAEGALQHSWFARWRQAPAGPASAKGGSAQQQQSQQRGSAVTGHVGKEVSALRERGGSALMGAAVVTPLAVGCCGGAGGAVGAATAAVGLRDLALAACCGGSNIVPLLTSPTLPGGSDSASSSWAAAGANGHGKAPVVMGGSDDEDAPSCLAQFHH